PPLLVHAQVVGDAVHPGVEGRLPLEAVEALVGLRERLLHDVERVFPAAQHAERQRGDLALVALDQLAEGVVVTRPRALDELPVARSHGTLVPDRTGRRPGYSAAAGRGGAPRAASMGLRPGGAVAHVHLERDPQRVDVLHGLPYGRLAGCEPIRGDPQ